MDGGDTVGRFRALCLDGVQPGMAFEFGEGCIDPILHRLEADRMLSARRETVAGRSRVVYQVTDKGRKQLVTSVACWEQVVKAVDRVLRGGADDGQPVLA